MTDILWSFVGKIKKPFVLDAYMILMRIMYKSINGKWSET